MLRRILFYGIASTCKHCQYLQHRSGAEKSVEQEVKGWTSGLQNRDVGQPLRFKSEILCLKSSTSNRRRERGTATYVTLPLTNTPFGTRWLTYHHKEPCFAAPGGCEQRAETSVYWDIFVMDV